MNTTCATRPAGYGNAALPARVAACAFAIFTALSAASCRHEIRFVCSTTAAEVPTPEGHISLTDFQLRTIQPSGGVSFTFDPSAATYPMAARKARMQGTVEINGTLGSSGARDLIVVRSVNHLLDRAALSVVKTLSVPPAALHEASVPFTVSVRFTLGKGSA